MIVTFRALPVWPYPSTPDGDRRSVYTFKAGWADTMDYLEREIRMIGGSEIIIGAGFTEGDIRRDGMPRADARKPIHPGIEISFSSQHGRLTYATDVCDFWQHNVRSIALGLEALRAVDRYGISRKGQQYAGFAQIGPGRSLQERGRRLVQEAGSVAAALKRAHPDLGGSPADLQAVIAFRDAEERE